MNTKHLLYKALAGIAFTIFVILIITQLKLTTPQVIMFLTGISFFFYLFVVIKQKRKFSFPDMLIQLAKTSVTVTIMVYLFRWFGGFGAVGVLIAIILLALFRLWKKKSMYLESLQHMEKMIFGKALDKDKWKRGELKDRKVKWVWGKKNDKHN